MQRMIPASTRVAQQAEGDLGEVKVEVTLTNAFEDSRARRGQIARESVRSDRVTALVDTGAVHCVLPPFVADRLGLERPFRQVVESADGRREEVDVTEPVLIEIEGRKVYEECLVLGDEVLIGQTALEKADLHVDRRERRLLPNPEHPYQPTVKVKYQTPSLRWTRDHPPPPGPVSSPAFGDR